MKTICKHCGEDILSDEILYEIDGGFVHAECMEDYVDEKWDELNLINKLQLMMVSTSTTSHRGRYGFDE